MTNEEIDQIVNRVSEKIENSHQGVAQSVSGFGADLSKILIQLENRGLIKNKKDDGFFGTLNKIVQYWPILIFLVAIIVTWVNFKNADATADMRLTKTEIKLVEIDTSQENILVHLSQIQTDLAWLKDKLNAK